LPQPADFEVTQHVFEKLVEKKTIDPLFVSIAQKKWCCWQSKMQLTTRWWISSN